MKEITTTDTLREALNLQNVPAEQLQERFKQIAEALLTKFAIRKGKQLFYITDIEFYYYTNNHKDLITYPRDCRAGEWFFHDSGVDIAFESYVEFDKETYKPVLNSKAKFGGILIRSIIPANEETKESLKGDEKRLINHPLNISDFLFDHFDALADKKDNRFPVLVECSHSTELEEQPCPRYIKIKDIDKKFEDIKKYNYARIDIENDNLKTEFIKYLPEKEKELAKLRYTIRHNNL